MSSIPIIDGHIDLAWNKINLGRHFQDSVNIKRLLEPVAVTSILRNGIEINLFIVAHYDLHTLSPFFIMSSVFPARTL